MELDGITQAAGELLRQQKVEEINREPKTREQLEEIYGQVWDSAEVARDFVITGFLAPLVAACRKADGQKGSLWFQHGPRFYFGFEPDDPAK
jgi:hypothetical protein